MPALDRPMVPGVSLSRRRALSKLTPDTAETTRLGLTSPDPFEPRCNSDNPHKRTHTCTYRTHTLSWAPATFPLVPGL